MGGVVDEPRALSRQFATEQTFHNALADLRGRGRVVPACEARRRLPVTETGRPSAPLVAVVQVRVHREGPDGACRDTSRGRAYQPIWAGLPHGSSVAAAESARPRQNHWSFPWHRSVAP